MVKFVLLKMRRFFVVERSREEKKKNSWKHITTKQNEDRTVWGS